MRLWVLTLAALLTAGALAGCTSTDDSETDDAGIAPPEGGDGGDGNGNEGQTPAGNGNDNGNDGSATPGNGTPPATSDPEPPTAELTASVTEGEAPLDVVFTLTGGSPDGRDITWTLDVNGDGEADYEGSELPAEVVHNYNETGEYDATFSVSNGQEDASSTVSITVLPAASTGPIQTETGSWQTTNPTTCAEFYPNPYHPANEAQDGISLVIFEVDPATIETAFRAEFSGGPTVLSSHLHFSSSDTIILEAFSDSGADVVIEGVVPAGAERVTFQTCGVEGSEVIYEAGMPS